MARLDVPTLQCDKCRIITTDQMVMSAFHKINHDGQSEYVTWDLCPGCWNKFLKIFMTEDITWDEMYKEVRSVLIAEIENDKQTTTDDLASAASRRALDMMNTERA